MSFFMGKKAVGGDPLLHMTSDTKTPAQMDSDPGATTVFHSDLPYVFVRERFEITSYTNWNGANGGRKFSFPSALQTFRTNNPDLAYLLMLEDSTGNKWLHDPIIDVRGEVTDNENGWSGSDPYYEEIVACLNGIEYQVAYTSSDSQLESLTQNTLRDTIWTFRTYDTTDTSVTVFKTPFRELLSSLYSMFFNYNPDPGYDYILEYMSTAGSYTGTDLESVGNDVVKVTFFFLNVEHTPSTFNRQRGFAYNYIKISSNQFIVNSIDLEVFCPLVSHGFVLENTTTTPYTTGDLVCGKAEGVNGTEAKIDSTGKLINGDSSVLEIPTDPSVFSGWDADFTNQVIKRNGTEVFNSTWAQRALFVAGEKEITFNLSLTLTDATVTSNVSSTQTGDIGSVDANTVYLASVVWAGSKAHSTSVYHVGDNVLAFFCLGDKTLPVSGPGYTWPTWCNNIWYYLNIATDGTCTVKSRYEVGSFTGNEWRVYSSVDLDLPSMTIRLISLVSM